MGYNIYYKSCCLCRINGFGIRPVCIQDNLQILNKSKSFKKILNKYNPYSFLLMCEDCLMKLRILGRCDTKYFLEHNYQIMKSDDNNPIHFEDTNCQCEHCKAKYGNLPLLAEVIEKFADTSKNTQEDKTEIQIPITVQKLKKEDSPQPSTSKSDTVFKKVMNCEHCSKSFTHKGDLNKHLRSHTGEQPFECPICKRKFAHTSNLTRHLRLHSGDKPFQCERCNKSFSRKDKLEIHKKTKLCLKSGNTS